MWGLSLAAWNMALLISLGATAVAAAVGVVSTYAVIKLQEQQQIEADKDAAALREKTAKAESDLAALKERLKPRQIDANERGALVDQLKKAPKARVSIEFPTPAGDEALRLAKQIQSILHESGWPVKDTIGASPSGPRGVTLYQGTEGPMIPAVDALGTALHQRGFDPRVTFDPNMNRLPDAILLVVGAKP